MGGKRRKGSTAAGLWTVASLIMYGYVCIGLGRDLLAVISPVLIVGGAAIVFAIVLIIWTYSHQTKWVGNPTVSMVTGVLAALIAISAFVRTK